MILGVLAEIAVLARLGDGGNHRRPIDRLQLPQFRIQLREALRGQRDLLHVALRGAGCRSARPI
jgi:hypothetical protein